MLKANQQCEAFGKTSESNRLHSLISISSLPTSSLKPLILTWKRIFYCTKLAMLVFIPFTIFWKLLVILKLEVKFTSVDTGNVQSIGNFFMSLESNWQQCQKQDLRYYREWQFCNFFYGFEIKEECKEDYMEVGESKTGIGLTDRKILCSLQGGYFKGC